MADFRSELVNAANREFSRFAQRDERDDSVAPILREYWMDGTGINDKDANKAIRDRTAWSAAFISWIVKKALHESESPAAFKFNGSHSVYAGRAILNKLNGLAPPAFFGLPPTAEGALTPEVGDLIGVTRVKWIDDYADAMGAARRGDTYFSHFDVVTEKSGGLIRTVGGNVSQTISKKKFTLNNGILPILPFKYDRAGRVTSGPFICVIKYE